MQWHWSFNDRLEAIRTGAALKFGDLAHQSLALWYPPGKKRGVHPATSFERLYNEHLEQGMREFNIRLDDNEEWVDALELGITMMREYVDRWGKDDHIKVISPEFPFQTNVYDKHGRYMVTYVGTFDLVFEDLNTGQIGLMETKTTKAISTSHLGLDEQGGSYWTFAPIVLAERGILKKGRDLDFIMYNFLRKAKPDERPVNEDGHRLNKPTKDALLAACEANEIDAGKSPKIETLCALLEANGIDPVQLGEVSRNQPPPYFLRQRMYRGEVDREQIMYRIRAQAWEMAKVRAGKLPLYKAPGLSWPNQICDGCEFKAMCELHETGGAWEELRDLTMTTWDPYADHRDPTEED